MLLELEEIQAQLDLFFAPLEPTLMGFRLLPSPVSLDEVLEFESLLGEHISEPLRNLLLQFQFGKFTLGPIVFCNGDDYLSRLLDCNTKGKLEICPRWWGAGMRPAHFFLIAVSDPFNILLNNSTGAILAFKDGETWHNNAIQIACNFERFLRGAGTVFLLRSSQGENEKLADQVSNDVGAEGAGALFWRWLAA